MRQPIGAGFLIAIGTLGGAGIGLAFGQSSLGLLLGFGGGLLFAVLITARDAMRQRQQDKVR